MHGKDIIQILRTILIQVKGPIKITYQTKANSNITEDLFYYHLKNIDGIFDYNISELFSLLSVIEYAINDLGEQEFSTVTGLNFYIDGYGTLNYVKQLILNSKNEILN